METLEQARRDIESLTAENVELRAFRENMMEMWGSIFANMGNAGMFCGGGLLPTENRGPVARPALHVPTVHLNPGFGVIPQSKTLDSPSTVLDGTPQVEGSPPDTSPKSILPPITASGPTVPVQQDWLPPKLFSNIEKESSMKDQDEESRDAAIREMYDSIAEDF
jgi:hypothetical protein